jgi:formate hydrogenlyase transcriptional activator
MITGDGTILKAPLPVPDGAVSANLQTLADAERQHILSTLETCGWRVSGPEGAAARLGLKRSTLQFRMKKLGIEPPGRLQR